MNTVAIDFAEIVKLTNLYLGHFDLVVSAIVTNKEASKPVLGFYSNLAKNTGNYLHNIFEK